MKNIRLVNYKDIQINGASNKEVLRMLEDLNFNVENAIVLKDELFVTSELKACLDVALQACPNDATVQEITNAIYGKVTESELITLK